MKDIRTFYPALIIFLVLYFLSHKIFHAFCPMVIVTGFPCAGCGLTRAFLYLLQGQFIRAIKLNPMVIPIFLFLIYFFVYRYLLGKTVRYLNLLLALLAVAALVTYGIRMYLYFPGRPPYVYTQDNVLSRQIPWYSELIQYILSKITAL